MTNHVHLIPSPTKVAFFMVGAKAVSFACWKGIYQKAINYLLWKVTSPDYAC